MSDRIKEKDRPTYKKCKHARRKYLADFILTWEKMNVLKV